MSLEHFHNETHVVLAVSASCLHCQHGCIDDYFLFNFDRLLKKVYLWMFIYILRGKRGHKTQFAHHFNVKFSGKLVKKRHIKQVGTAELVEQLC